jgi:hypothetical protein
LQYLEPVRQAYCPEDGQVEDWAVRILFFINPPVLQSRDMKQVSRNIEPENAQDLLERVPRACLSFTGKNGVQVQPVGLQWRDGRFLVCISGDTGRQPVSGQEAVLLVDEGIYYFELRAIYIRGRLEPAEYAPAQQAGRSWFELNPLKIVAWDYGTLHEVKDGH